MRQEVENSLVSISATARFLGIGAIIVTTVLVISFAWATLWVHEWEESHRLLEVERAMDIAERHVRDLIARIEDIFDGIDGYLDGKPVAEVHDGFLRHVESTFTAGAPLGSRIGFWQLDGSGRLAFSGLNAADRDYFRMAVDERAETGERDHFQTDRGLIIGTPVKSRSTEKWTLPISRTLRAFDGRPSGVVVVSVPIDTFVLLYSSLRADDGDLFALWRHDRTMLFRAPFREDMQSLRIPGAPVWTHYPERRSGTYEAPTVTDGVARLVTFRGLEPLPLVLVYAFDRRGISWNAAATYWPLVAIGGGALLAALGYAALAAGYLKRLRSTLSELYVLHQRASQVAEARGRFIGTMNHELRTPLNAIIGFSEILGAQMFGPLGNRKYLEYVNDISSSGQHLLSLVDDIMDLSAIDQDIRQIESVSVDLGQSLGEVLALVEPARRQRDITILVDGTLPTVVGDTRAVRQIVQNVVSNAIKFSPKGSEVICIARSRPEEGRAGFSIVDCGIGIEPGELDQIGTAYFRSRAAARMAIPGTGLGLSIACGLAAKMGGELTVKSEAGFGTTVTLMLPLHNPSLAHVDGQQVRRNEATAPLPATGS
jgi:signal transduction histidine kinase